MNKEIEIPEGYEARIEGNKVIIELKESEDERIRNELWEYFHNLQLSSDCDFSPSFTIDDILAYLEKQKEQKPVHTAKEMWKEMRLEVYAQASGNRHEPNYSDDSTKMFSLCDIDEIFEKIGNSTVGSQHVEWSEEDELYQHNIIAYLKFRKDKNLPEDTKYPVLDAWIDWLKSIRPQPNWKPSEEQMVALEDILNILHLYKRGAIGELYQQLKKL